MRGRLSVHADKLSEEANLQNIIIPPEKGKVAYIRGQEFMTVVSYIFGLFSETTTFRLYYCNVLYYYRRHTKNVGQQRSPPASGHGSKFPQNRFLSFYEDDMSAFISVCKIWENSLTSVYRLEDY